MNRIRKIYEGKANTLYETNSPFLIEMESTDRISAGNGQKKDMVKGKGLTNNAISSALFKIFESKGIPTHYVCKGSNEYSKIVKAARMIRLEVIGRFIAAGSFCKRYGIEHGKVFEDMTIEFCYKDDALNDPFISPTAAAYGLKVAPISHLKLIEKLTYAIGKIAKEFFKSCNLTLVDFKVEFGYDVQSNNLMLCDEFSPDTCRLWDENGNSLDKDVFRNDSGDVEETYRKVLEKVTSILNS